MERYIPCREVEEGLGFNEGINQADDRPHDMDVSVLIHSSYSRCSAHKLIWREKERRYMGEKEDIKKQQYEITMKLTQNDYFTNFCMNLQNLNYILKKKCTN